MIASIVDASIRRRYAVVVIAAVIVAIGVIQLRDTHIDAAPEFGPTFVEVQTEALGLSTAEVEQLITVPLEQDLLNGVAWVDTIQSRSIPGLSSVVMTFEPGTDMLDARQMVQERLTQAHALPNVSDAPAMIQPVSSTSRVMMIGLSSDEHTLIDQSVLARWTIRPRLLSVPGVANVSIWGQRERQLQVQVDPQTLADRGVPLIDVISTAGNALWVSPLTFLDASTPGTGGFIETPNQRIGVRHILPITTADDLAQVPVVGHAGEFTLGDIATVIEGHQPLIGDAIVGGGEGIILVVEKLPWASATAVTAGVDGALSALAPGLAGITVDPTVFRTADYVDSVIANGWLALVAGAVLLLVALGLLFFQWRYALISALAITTSLITATLVLTLTRSTLDLVALTGLAVALAVIVDDGIVDLDTYRGRLRRAARHDTDVRLGESIAGSSISTRTALAFAVGVTLVTLLPLYFTVGDAGALLPPMAVAYAIAIVASTGVALTVTPALAAILLPRSPGSGHGVRLRHAIEHGYRRVLTPLSRVPATAVLGAVALLLVGLVTLPGLQLAAAPQFRDRELLIGMESAPGVSRVETRRVAGQVASELGAIQGVKKVGAHVGRAILSDEVANVDHGEIWIGIEDDADYDATLASIATVIGGYPGLEFARAQAYANERLSDVLAIDEEDIVVRVFGEDLAQLSQQVEKITAAMGAIEGVTEIEAEFPAMEPTVEIEVDLGRAQAAGIKPGDVRRAAATLLSGLHVGSLFEDQKVFDVVVWGTPETRASVTAIQDLIIDRPEGGHVRLGDVAAVRVAPNPQVIRHDSVRRYVDIEAAVGGISPADAAATLSTAIAGLDFPLDYHAEILTPSSDPQDAAVGVLVVAVATALGVILLMQAALGSWRFALVAAFTLPLSVVGGLVAVWLIGGTVNIGAVAGFIAIIALATRYGILLFGGYREPGDGDPDVPLRRTVLRGSTDRLGPTLMTAIALCAALLPVLVMGAQPGLEVVFPTAAVVVGGVVTAVIVSLFIAPPLYLLVAGQAVARPEPADERRSTPGRGPERVPEGSLSASHRRSR